MARAVAGGGSQACFGASKDGSSFPNDTLVHSVSSDNASSSGTNSCGTETVNASPLMTIAVSTSARVLSNDEMRDHAWRQAQPRYFSRWKARHLVHFDFSHGARPDRPPLLVEIQVAFPPADRRRWPPLLIALEAGP